MVRFVTSRQIGQNLVRPNAQGIYLTDKEKEEIRKRVESMNEYEIDQLISKYKEIEEKPMSQWPTRLR